MRLAVGYTAKAILSEASVCCCGTTAKPLVWTCSRAVSMLPADGCGPAPCWRQQIAARVASRDSSVSTGRLVCLRCVCRVWMCCAQLLVSCRAQLRCQLDLISTCEEGKPPDMHLTPWSEHETPKQASGYLMPTQGLPVRHRSTKSSDMNAVFRHNRELALLQT